MVSMLYCGGSVIYALQGDTGIQGASKAMMEEEDGNEEQVDELQATETGSDMGSVVEQAGPVTPTKGKGKNTSKQTTSLLSATPTGLRDDWRHYTHQERA